MGRRGPAQKSAKARKLQGHPGKRPGKTWAPRGTSVAPSCPTWLDGEAMAEWKRIVPQLEEMKLLAKVDRASLAAHCLAWSRLKRAEQLIQKEGLTYKTDQGMIKRYPAVSIAHEASMEIKAFAAEFGLTANARNRLPFADDHDEIDAFELFVGFKNAQKQ